MQRVETADWTGMRAETAHKEFEAFFCANRDAMQRVALAITGDPDSAHDAVQEAFVKVLDRWSRVKQMESPEGFLKMTVVRASIDILRTRKRNGQLDDNAQTVSQSDVAVKHALAQLKPDQQAILALAFGEGWSYAEIAEALQIPPGTVASRIHNAKEAFRRHWGNER